MADKSMKGHRQRLRQRFLAAEDRSLTEEALLELLLTYSFPQRDVEPLAKQLISEFGGLSGVLSASPEALQRLRGIQSATATLLKLVDWIRVCYASEGGPEAPVFGPRQGVLFEVSAPQSEASPAQPPAKPRTQPRPPARRRTGPSTNMVLREAIALLPHLPDTDSAEEIRAHLQASLHYNSNETRRRYAGYILRQVFPEGRVDRGIRTFARHFRDTRDLREACFYRLLKAEPFLQRVVEEVLLPAIGNGSLPRSSIRHYLSTLLPGDRRIESVTQGMVAALAAGGIARSDPVKITFAYRDITLPAFAFVVHSEFPEPAMYDISKLEDSGAVRSMLWSPGRVLPALYELRNRGIISKVSEIDNVRQFTTRWQLDDMVDRLTSETGQM